MNVKPINTVIVTGDILRYSNLGRVGKGTIIARDGSYVNFTVFADRENELLDKSKSVTLVGSIRSGKYIKQNMDTVYTTDFIVTSILEPVNEV